jgi:hypothetical protein
MRGGADHKSIALTIRIDAEYSQIKHEADANTGDHMLRQTPLC